MRVFGGQAGDILARLLKAYAERKGAAAAKALLSPQSLRDSIADFPEVRRRKCDRERVRPGAALEGCVAPLVNDAEVQRFLKSAVAGGAALVESRFPGRISGVRDIPPGLSGSRRALIQVTDFARALTMRALIGTPRKTLLKEAEEAADLVLLPLPKAVGKRKL